MSAPLETPVPTNRQAFADIARALRYILPFRGRFGLKLFYQTLTVIPSLLLPWPAKVLVDHVIQDIPFGDTRYPFFFQPVIEALHGASPTTIAVTMLAFSAALLLLFGGYASDARDTTSSGLAAGVDTATTQENAANEGFSFMSGIFGWIEYRLSILLTQDLNHYYRSRLFGHIQRLPMTELDDRRIGDAIYRLMYDTPQITEVCYRIILTPIVTPLLFVSTVIVMATTFDSTPVVWVPALVLFPVGLLVTVPFSKLVRSKGKESREAGATTTATLEEGVANVLAVQSLGGQEHEKAHFESNSWDSYKAYLSFQVVWMIIGAVAGVASIPLFLYMYYALTDQVFAGTMTVGDLGVILAFYGQLTFMTVFIGRLWIYLQDNIVGLRRVFELMDRPSDPQPENPVALPSIDEGFSFEAVGFRYPDGTRALSGISFEARRGEMIALVGPAGAGKTTLAQMFPRFLSSSEGRIEVDGMDLESIDRDDLRAQIAFVFQEPALFDATPLENIRVGKPDATLEEVREAARLARVDAFVQALPQGYDTPLGRAGGRLSVGQKQRLSIARALVRNAPVLVLDAPTAALDPETEAQLVETLREASRDRLVVVIAHRLSTIRSADQILFLSDGQIIERGSHDELVAREGGAYRHFVELQTGNAAA
ncbi:MAG: ABC transporter ATP-binding protein [Myxococcota bacterium]